MHKLMVIAAFLAAFLPALSQEPAVTSEAASRDTKQSASADPVVYKSDLDFNYTYTSDWTVVDTKPIMPTVHMQTEDKATSDPEKQAAACVQIGLLLKRGTPGSVVMAMALPWDCLGKTYKNSDLAGFGSGVAKGFVKSFDVENPLYGAYKLGKHDLWIERMEGTAKDHPDFHRTVEVACVLLKKGAVCMVGLVNGEADLKTFEQSSIALEGDAPAQLVPDNAFTANH